MRKADNLDPNLIEETPRQLRLLLDAVTSREGVAQSDRVIRFVTSAGSLGMITAATIGLELNLHELGRGQSRPHGFPISSWFIERPMLNSLAEMHYQSSQRRIAATGAPQRRPARTAPAEVELVAAVVQLHRPYVTFTASIDDEHRRIRASHLPEDLYRLATEAHLREQSVVIQGVLVDRGPGRLAYIELESIEIA